MNFSHEKPDDLFSDDSVSRFNELRIRLDQYIKYASSSRFLNVRLGYSS